MKRNRWSFIAVLVAGAMLWCLICTSCNLGGTNGGDETTDAVETEDIETTGGSDSTAGTDADTEGADGETDVETNAREEENPKDSGVSSVIQVTINAQGSDVAMAAAQGLRSAVSIYCTFEMTRNGGSYWNPRPSTQTYYSTGSGVIYRLGDDGDAFIVTNHHVVYDADCDAENGISEQIYLYLYGMESDAYAIPATYVGGSANYDLAVLRVEESAVLKEAAASGAAQAVAMGDADTIYPGQTTIAIGNPAADELSGLSVTTGIVSVDSEYITMTASTGKEEVTFRVIRTDAPINAGNSGGGMYNDRGELIGIVNAKIMSSDIENIGYALPCDVVRGVADNIIDHCFEADCESVMRAMLGITVEVSGYDTYFDTARGVLIRVEEIRIREVTAGRLGETIFEEKDVVKSITVGDKTIEVTRQHHLIDAMLDLRAGDTVSFALLRDGNEITVNAVIGQEELSAY